MGQKHSKLSKQSLLLPPRVVSRCLISYASGKHSHLHLMQSQPKILPCLETIIHTINWRIGSTARPRRDFWLVVPQPCLFLLKATYARKPYLHKGIVSMAIRRELVRSRLEAGFTLGASRVARTQRPTRCGPAGIVSAPMTTGLCTCLVETAQLSTLLRKTAIKQGLLVVLRYSSIKFRIFTLISLGFGCC